MQLPAMIYRPGQTAAPSPGGRWSCARFEGEVVAGGVHAVCRQRPEQLAIVARPRDGCAFWMREPGADDLD
jgi:hypothetical protein